MKKMQTAVRMDTVLSRRYSPSAVSKTKNHIDEKNQAKYFDRCVCRRFDIFAILQHTPYVELICIRTNTPTL